ncbi:diaminopimelate epimerase [Nakamurella silvestris]|nr:diaminopimelate epimerase [Nakamurella silvestris]
MDAPVPFAKGHGTENDFVILPDLTGRLEVSADQVRAVCDRRAGIGGDGIIRIAPDPAGGYFMDHRNSDGSLAQMCGNGARLFVRYLVDNDLVEAGQVEFGTRAGRRSAEVLPDGRVRLGMGAVTIGPESASSVAGVSFPGVAVDVGNPHLVAFIEVPVDTLNLLDQPQFDEAVFADGVNLEYVNVLGPGEVRMRVHERGVGETRSCGTGTVAVAAAHLRRQGAVSGTVLVHVPGGTIEVGVEGGTGTITGPAVVVGSGGIDPAWWNAHR